MVVKMIIKKIIWLISLLLYQSSAAAVPLKIILDWFPNPDHAPIIIAEQKGFFKEQGLDVELIGPLDPNDPPKLVALKKADIGITYQPAFLEQVDRQLPLIHIGTLIDKPLNCLLILKNGKNSSIQNLKDLKQKKIGSVSDSLSSVMLKTMLKKQGLSENEVTLINVRYNLTQALLSHKVDAVTGIMRNVEVPILELQGHQTLVFFPEEYGVPKYSELIFITHLDLAKDKRFPKFFAAIKKAINYLDEHPKESWEVFAKTYPESNNVINKKSWFVTLPYFAKDPLYFNINEWQRFAEFMKENQLIKKIDTISRYTYTIQKN
jgi:putative hydroxymethylpyrimidine transport system substrate-binding protein